MLLLHYFSLSVLTLTRRLGVPSSCCAAWAGPFVEVAAQMCQTDPSRPTKLKEPCRYPVSRHYVNLFLFVACHLFILKSNAEQHSQDGESLVTPVSFSESSLLSRIPMLDTVPGTFEVSSLREERLHLQSKGIPCNWEAHINVVLCSRDRTSFLGMQPIQYPGLLA